MDIRTALLENGFDRVVVLSVKELGLQEQAGTLILALKYYVSQAQPGMDKAWIHSYYPASQQAWTAANRVLAQAKSEGIGLSLRDDIRVKPIFARLPGFGRGRNTINSTAEIGSRFHVQIFLLDEELPPDLHPLPVDQPFRCGDCHACVAVCPGHAIDEDGFHRERCLRNWMFSGKPVPMPLRSAMGNRLIGCDECQRCCPHNPPSPDTIFADNADLHELLTDTKQACEKLKPLIGVNLALPNRVLAQACLIAGNTGDPVWIPILEPLTKHPSPVVAEHAAWAIEQLQ